MTLLEQQNKQRLMMAAPAQDPMGGNVDRSRNLQDYQMQLMLLEQHNIQRRMMGAQGGSLVWGNSQNSETVVEPSVSSASNAQTNTKPAEVAETHYTISEDEIRKGLVHKIAVLAQRSNLPQRVEASESPQDAKRDPKLASVQQHTINPTQRKAQAPELPAHPSSPIPYTSVPGPSTTPLTERSQQSPLSSLGPPPQQWPQFERTQSDTGHMQEKSGEAVHGPENPSTVRDVRPDANGSQTVSREMATFNPELATLSSAGCIGSGYAGGFEANTRNLDLSDTGIAPSDHLSLLQMQQRIDQLEAGINEKSQTSEEIPLRNHVEICHCLLDNDTDEPTNYLSEPEWVIHTDEVWLRAHSPVINPRDYAEKKANVAFIVYKFYSVDYQRAAVEKARKFNKPLPSPEPAYQEVQLISDEILEGIKAHFALYPKCRYEFPEEVGNTKLKSPFVWWYHCRRSSNVRQLPHHQAEQVSVLTNWIEENYKPLYDQIDDQFRRGRVSNVSMGCLFRPGQVLVSFSDDVPQGHLATTGPLYELSGYEGAVYDGDDEVTEYARCWSFASRSYSYSGNFMREEEDLQLDFVTETTDGEVDITSLPFVPLEYTAGYIRETLLRRGKTFWKCRNKRLVSYECTSTGQKRVGERFMTDFETYKSFHPSNKYSMAIRKEKEPGLPKDGSEPREPEIYLFPNQIPGFDLRRKKWVDLDVDKIQDVAWNEHAFSNLVADENMKTLILALVTNQLEAARGTDVIDNKGNGLIMLLHGPPGTGKTFTAESVAEIAKKPLYPVTCGDIGTEPEAVEKYLEPVFFLGKAWDCVVLLDEAEVFLEQRTLQDLKRNALVSIFLRALEYYDGILILTTNRAGTFDEAFKSRIQLAVRYESLKDHQRQQVWRNFFNRLKALGEEDSINFDDIAVHLNELTRYPMNGRQIRNSITTARQLAKFLKKRMDFSDLQRTISIMDKFDRYLADVREADVDDSGGRGLHGRYSDEYFARSDQLR